MLIEQLLHTRRSLWKWQPQAPLSRLLMHLFRAGDALLAVLLKGDLSLRATSLVYTTLLTLAPFLALGFSLLKAFGIHNQLEPVLLESLKALGPEKAREVAQNIMGFVEKIDVGVLGAVGVGLLLYSAISLIQKVEEAFNQIWRVEQARLLSQRLGEYLAVLTVGPLVVFSALGATASIFNNSLVVWLGSMPVFGFMVHLVTATVPYVLIVALFTFLYGFVPNTRVKPLPAFIGGLVAGLMWQSASFIFATFVASATNYNAIYSGFAIIIFVLIWLQLGWLILLCGCQLAYFAQNPERMNPYASVRHPGGRAREQLGLTLMLHIAQAFIGGKPPPNRAQLAALLGLTEAALADLAEPLVAGKLLAESGVHWLPARDPASVKVSEVWQLLRGSGADDGNPALKRASGWIGGTEKTGLAGSDLSLRDWASSQQNQP